MAVAGDQIHRIASLELNVLRASDTLGEEYEQRFSSFQRSPGMREGLPAAADWIDPARIRERARGAARVGETAGEPMLTFDRNPDRLVWAVTLVSSSGARELYVAGETVYEPPPEGTFG